MTKPNTVENSATREQIKHRILLTVVFLAVSVTLTFWAAFPIYHTPMVLVPIVVGSVIGFGTVLLHHSGLRFAMLLPLALFVFVLLLVPVAAPSGLQNFPVGFFPAMWDALQATVLGYKQLLTLELPVGTYQTVMVPLFTMTTIMSVAITALIVRKTGAMKWAKIAVWAAAPFAVEILWLMIFGTIQHSAGLRLGFLAINSPLETALWLALLVSSALFVWYVSGLHRRKALRAGRLAARNNGVATSSVAKNRGFGALFATILLVTSLAIALFMTPLLFGDKRGALRQDVTPPKILTAESSPLATYRASKSDNAMTQTWFQVHTTGQMPQRLRFAALDYFDGSNFRLGSNAVDNFSRFPGGVTASQTSSVSVNFGAGYNGAWVPVSAPLAGTPEFGGARARDLADEFYVNRESGTAIVAFQDSAQGMREGDSVRVQMSVAPTEKLTAGPGTQKSLALDGFPEMKRWLDAQKLGTGAESYLEAVKRLRERGYLSHGIDQRAGATLWVTKLKAQGGSFMSSPGGHSQARIERLFKELNKVQEKVSAQATNKELVAATGDDEQFAAAAALLGRAMGYDTRVVVGMRMHTAAGSTDVDILQAVPVCQDTCSGEHLAAWVEIKGNNGVWATVDVTPQHRNLPVTVDAGEKLPKYITEPQEHDASQIDPPQGLSASGDSQSQNEKNSIVSRWLIELLRTIGLWLLLLLGLLLPILCIPILKSVRRKRRRTAGAAMAQVLGAWYEIRDTAIDAGALLPVPKIFNTDKSRKRTRNPILIMVRNLRRRFARPDLGAPLEESGGSRVTQAEMIDTDQAFEVAWRVDEAVFGVKQVTAETSDYLWRLVDEDRRIRRETSTRWERIKAAYSLRSLGVRFGQRR